MDYFVISKVWDLSKKQAQTETLKITTESHLLIQVLQVILNCEGKCIEGRGKVIKTGSFVGRFQDKTVCFLKADSDYIREFEVVLGQHCVVCETEEFLIEYPLKAMMIYDFLLEKTYSHIIHVSDNVIFTKILDKMCLDLRIKIINSMSESAYDIIKVLKFEMLLLGNTVEHLSMALEGNEDIVTYNQNLINENEDVVNKELCLMTWLLGLSSIKRTQYYNYIRSHKELFDFNPQVINSMNLIRDSLTGDKIRILIINDLFATPEAPEKNKKPIEFKLPLHTINKRNCSIHFSPNESCESLESAFRSFLSLEEVVDINCLESPRFAYPYGNISEAVTSDNLYKQNAVKHHESRLSIESTDFSFSHVVTLDKASEDFSMIEYLTGLISKYRNDYVLYVLSSINLMHNYENSAECVDGTYLKLLSDLSVYEGQMNEDKRPHGFGTRYYADGSVFRGFWKAGQASGHGLMVTSDEFIYNGQWKNGLCHGYGSQRTKSKDYCEGTFRYGELDGIGIEILSNGDKYHGNFLNSLRHGPGKIIFKNGVVFLGQFFEGRIEGKGKVLFTDKVFEGIFNGNIGKGVMEYKDGSKFYGSLIDFKETGSGFFEIKGTIHRCYASDVEIQYFKDESSYESCEEDLSEGINV